MELPDRHRGDNAVVTPKRIEHPALPVDPDLGRPEDTRPDTRGRGLGSRLRPGILAAIAVGGALGGAARYGIEQALPTAPDAFP